MALSEPKNKNKKNPKDSYLDIIFFFYGGPTEKLGHLDLRMRVFKGSYSSLYTSDESLKEFSWEKDNPSCTVTEENLDVDSLVVPLDFFLGPYEKEKHLQAYRRELGRA